jgi:hypothetical protein
MTRKGNIPEASESVNTFNKYDCDYDVVNYFKESEEVSNKSNHKFIKIRITDNKSDKLTKEVKLSNILEDSKNTELKDIIPIVNQQRLTNDVSKNVINEVFTIEELVDSNKNTSKEEVFSIKINRSMGSRIPVGLLKLRSTINNQKETDILIDTGAKVNCVDFNFISELKNIHISKSKTVSCR